jgi:predicted amidohydrolase
MKAVFTGTNGKEQELKKMNRPIKAACVQIEASDVTAYAEAEQRIIQGIEQACSMGAEILVLPECSFPSYYVGKDMAAFEEAMARFPALTSAISSKAEEYGVHIASGFLAREKGVLYNLGILWGPDGNEIGRVRKCNMWHFDAKYVDHGKEFKVWNTPLGRIGMMICADGRVPEITRILALQGADLVLDMANLVTSGKDPEKLTNPQVDYMLPARARENGIWIMMADKVGLEAGTVLNSGSSCIIDPWGKVVIRGSSDKAEIVLGEIDLSIQKPLIPERKPQLYGELIKPNEDLGVAAMISSSLSVNEREVFSSVASFSYDSVSEYIQKAQYFLKILEDQDSSLIVLPPLRNDISMTDVRNKVGEVLRSKDIIVALAGYSKEQGTRCARIFTSEEDLGTFFNNHGNFSAEASPMSCVSTSRICIGAMFGEEGLIPEVARTYMLQGVELLLWFDAEQREEADIFCRTRASENRFYIIRSTDTSSGDTSSITDPFGQIKASSIPGMDQAVSTLVLRNLSKAKEVVPGTDVVEGRRPELYGLLVK